jgi:outer membrane protein assembly factor BamB
MRNSVVVTSSGLLFGIGGDGKVRAYDSETGKVLWTSAVGGGMGVRGSPSLYEIGGREYLLVPFGVASAAGARGGAAAAPLPEAAATASGYVVFALPEKAKG